MAKRIMKKTVDLAQGSLTITINGENKKYVLASLNQATQKHLTLHGLSQKLGDACAGKAPNFTTIDAVWIQLAARGETDNFSSRAPAEQKVKMSDLEKILTPDQLASILKLVNPGVGPASQ